jgi:hypothetical protein
LDEYQEELAETPIDKLYPQRNQPIISDIEMLFVDAMPTDLLYSL